MLMFFSLSQLFWSNVMEVFHSTTTKTRTIREERMKSEGGTHVERGDEESRRDSSEMRVRLVLSLFSSSSWRDLKRSRRRRCVYTKGREEKSEEENEESSQNFSGDVG